MARPWSNSRLVLAALAALAAATLFSSCLDLGVSVEFRTATSGQVKVDALTWRLAQGLQFADGTDRMPIPTTRAEWQTVADTVSSLALSAAPTSTPGTALTPALTIASWSGAEEDLGLRSSTVLNFTGTRALEGLFAVFKQKLTLTQDLGRWKLTFVPQVPRITAADPETRRLWTSLWGTRTWTFAFTPPGQPRAERSVPLSDLAQGQTPAEWTLSW